MTYAKYPLLKTIPCNDCSHKYQCDEKRLACAQFRYFVNTGYVSQASHCEPTRNIYADVFYKESIIKPRSETL
jgi:hypothetical protein